MSVAQNASALRIALVGTPNCGKTALFNRLTGSRQKVANYAGVTVERKEGYFRDPAGRRCAVLDLSARRVATTKMSPGKASALVGWSPVRADGAAEAGGGAVCASAGDASSVTAASATVDAASPKRFPLGIFLSSFVGRAAGPPIDPLVRRIARRLKLKPID